MKASSISIGQDNPIQIFTELMFVVPVLNRQDCGIHTFFSPPPSFAYTMVTNGPCQSAFPKSHSRAAKAYIASELRTGSGERIIWSLSLSTSQG